MNGDPDLGQRDSADAADELADLHQQVHEVRAELAGLQQEVAAAENDRAGNPAVELVEANQQLVLSALQAQDDAASAQRALDEASLSADFDSLTGLPNRALLLHRFAQALANAKRHGARLAVLFLDLDDFKKINDQLGHAIGDEVLKVAARCLASSVRDADTAGRYGGDEFLILLPDVSQASDASLIAAKVNAALGAVDSIGSPALRLTASIGISTYPDDGLDVDTLIHLADTAMYRAKRHGPGGFAFHGQEPAGERSAQAIGRAAPQKQAVRDEPAWALHERRFSDLREANEWLLLAVLGAQELQAAAEQAHEKQAAFLAVLAHELRMPLAPIGTAAALLAQAGTEEMPRIQAIIERQVAYMARLVSDLQDVSRVSTGKLRLERQVLDIAELVDEVTDACRPAMAARRQSFGIHQSARGLEIPGDRVRLTQVLGNLLDNASKYTPDGGTIELSVEVVEDALVMTVSDSGIGITAAALPVIFEPFAQDAHAITFHGGGCGIGLTVVRELVDAHGGNVIASSAGRGLGSRFVVTLPLR